MKEMLLDREFLFLHRDAETRQEQSFIVALQLENMKQIEILFIILTRMLYRDFPIEKNRISTCEKLR